MKTAAIYARVSTTDQTHNTSLDSQVGACRQYAEAHGFQVVREVREDWTGSDLDRPGINTLLDLAETGEIGAVIVRNVDRWSRGGWHVGYLDEKFRAAGCTVHFIDAPRSDDSPGGDMLVSFQAMIAFEEKRNIRRRLANGKLDSVREGQISGSGLVPLGYRYIPVQRDGKKRIGGGVYEVVEDEARLVREIFEWVAVEGLSLRKVCQRLAERDVPTRRGGSQWTPGTIRHMIRNPTYIGQYAYNRTESVAPAPDKRRAPIGKNKKTSSQARPESDWLYITCPAIVSPELFRAAGARLEANKEKAWRSTREFYLLRGFLYCAVCAEQGKRNKLVGRVIRSGAGRYLNRYYNCSGRFNRYDIPKEEWCQTLNQNAEQLEQRAWARLVEALSDPQAVRALLSHNHEEYRRDNVRDAQRLEHLEKGIHKARTGEERMLAAYQDGDISLKQLRAAKERARRQVEELRKEADEIMERMTRRAQVAVTTERLDELVDAARLGLPRLDLEARRAFLEACEFKATVDRDGNLDMDGWLTERLFPVLAAVAEEEGTVLHSRTKPIYSLDSYVADEWRVPIHLIAGVETVPQARAVVYNQAAVDRRVAADDHRH